MEHIDKLIKAYRREDPDLYEFRLNLSLTIPRRAAHTKHEEQQNHREFADAHRALRHMITGPIIEEILKTREVVLGECIGSRVRLGEVEKAFSELLRKIDSKVEIKKP